MQTSDERRNGEGACRARTVRWKLLPLLLALGMSQAAVAGPCGARPCLSTHSVVGAAGDDLRAALDKVEFIGDGLAPQSQGAIDTLAKTWASRSKKVLTLRVRADSALKGAAARAQAAARSRAVVQALVAAGLPKKQLKVEH